MNKLSNQPNLQSGNVQTINAAKRWKAFGQNRTLFVPAASVAAQHYAFDFFLASKWQRVAIKLASKVGFGRNVNVGAGVEWGEIQDAVALADVISASAEVQNIEVQNIKVANPNQLAFAMRQGSVGPYQKMSLIAIEQHGAPVFYAKVAVGDEADAMVEAESACLQRLSTIPTLNGMVPKKLSCGKTPAGRAFFITSVAPFLKTTNQFEAPHQKFLCTLAHATVQWVRYADSAEFQFAQSALERLRSVLGEAVYAELKCATHELLSQIGELKLPTVLAHRDFSPWNIRSNNTEIFVFDWEYAAEGASPLYDFFHFHLIQQALSRQGVKALSSNYMHSLISPAQQYLRKTFPELDWSPVIVKSLLLAYLVDLILFYVDSDKSYDANHPVLAAYYNAVVRRKFWLGHK